MLKIENVEVTGWDHAIRGMRNPMNSWGKTDSAECYLHATKQYSEAKCAGCDFEDKPEGCYIIGPNDHKLMMSLAKGGPVHAKYRRMINVYLDITAPLYWWKEFDTYKVGTAANSCSTMHKIHAKEFALGDFSHEHLYGESDAEGMYYSQVAEEEFTAADVLNATIEALNNYRKRYLEAKTKPMKDESKRAMIMKQYWWQMIQLLPTSYNQKRTVMLNYEVLHNIYHSRRHHKLDEWHVVCDWIESLPYSEIIIGEKTEEAE